MNRRHPYFIGTQELTDYFKARGIDCRKDSYQLARELRDLFRCEIPLKLLVLAACLAGFAVIPRGDRFTFCRVAD